MKIDDLNENRSFPINNTELNKFFDKVISKCSDSVTNILNNNVIYRGLGTRNKAEFMIWQQSNRTRSSANYGKDYYVDIINHLPSWKAFPDRSKSIICSIDYSYAASYSYNYNTYVVCPINGSVLAHCNVLDFWESEVDSDRKKLLIEEFPQFRGTGHDIYDIIGEIYQLKKTSSGVNFDRLLKVLNYVLDPASMNFGQADVANFFKLDMHPRTEVWTEGTCYAFNESYLNHFRDYVEDKR